MNLPRSLLLRSYFLSIVSFIIILISYFLPLFEGNCSEFFPCGPTPSLESDIFSILQTIHTFSDFINSLLFLFVLVAPALLAMLFVLLRWLCVRFESRKPLNTLFMIWTIVIWIIGFSGFILFLSFMLHFGAYPLFGCWGILLGYWLLFYSCFIFLLAPAKK